MSYSEWSSRAKQEWNERADSWYEESEGRWEKGSRKDVIPFVLQYAKAKTGPLLDAGCGDGYASVKLAQNGFQVIGMDLSDEMIEWAKKRGAGFPTLTFQQGDISSLPHPDSFFGTILCVNAMEFTPHPLQVFREFHRVLLPGGHLIGAILGPTAGPRGFSYPRLYGKEIIQNTMMPWEANQLAEENGFTLRAQKPVYKSGISPEIAGSLPSDLQQAVSFFTLFVWQKGADQKEQIR